MEKINLNIDETRQKAINFVTTSWQAYEINEKYPVKDYDSLINNAFNDLVADKDKYPMMMRICGQSGSGKSTQLLPAAKEGFKMFNVNPICVAVRNFAPYHPYYNEIKEKYGEDMLRENTNGFALLLLFLTLEKLIISGYPIIFEVTLLDSYFELYFAELAKKYNYHIDYHLISVSKNQSDRWIDERKIFSEVEKNRIVATSSSDYFYKALPIAIESLQNIENSNKCYIWNGYQNEPVYSGLLSDKKVLQNLRQFQKETFAPKNPDELRMAKISWFKKHYSSKLSATS